MTALDETAAGYTDRAVSPGLVYLCAVVSLCDSDQASEATGAHRVPIPLAAPTGLSATTSHDSVTLTWTPPAGPVLDYLVFRQAPSDTEMQFLGNATSATYTDSTVAASTAYSRESWSACRHPRTRRPTQRG